MARERWLLMKVVSLDNKKYGFEWLIDEMKQLHEDEGIELMICIYKKKDGYIGFGTTRGNDAEFLGLIELGKAQLIDDMYEN